MSKSLEQHVVESEAVPAVPAVPNGHSADPVEGAVEASEEEHPFKGLTEGWKFLGRGKGQPGRVKVRSSFSVSLDSATAKWAEREATAAGTDIFTYLASLVTQAKARQEATQEGAETE